MLDPIPANILIVDDDEAKRYGITKILQKAGFATREVATGAEALRLAAELPDLIVLDVKLPDMSGFEVCRQIKTNPATATIPVLHISTTFVDIQDKVHGLEGGADGYLTDALEPLELIATVNALLRARRAEEAAQLSHRQWQTTFDAINDGVILLDGDGKIVQVNQALERILDKPSRELLNIAFHELIALDPNRTHSPFSRMLESHRREVAEVKLSDRWLYITVDPLRNGKNVVNGALCIVSDITDRREMEEELRRRAEDLAAADRRKDEFLAMLAHELRNPLSPILNSLEVIQLQGRGDAYPAESLEIAKRQVRHMSRLLDDLLDVSRFTQGKIQLRKGPVDFSAVVSHAVEITAPLIKSKGHHLEINLPPHPIWMIGDMTRLEQVVANLLSNAAKYTPPKGRITLTTSLEGKELVLRVRDTGIGLNEEMLPRVFDLFTQADLSLDRTQGGLGIGLTLVKSLVEMHGGSVVATSRGLGEGSEFIGRLPLSSGSPASPPSAAPAASSSGSSSLRVLIVDDHRDSASSMAQILEKWGHQTCVVHDGIEALQRVSTDTFDVVLLDIGLPGMSGYEVAERIREKHGRARPLLVALTGYGQDQDVIRSKKAGFDQHLIKPVMLETLQSVLEIPMQVSLVTGSTSRERQNDSVP